MKKIYVMLVLFYSVLIFAQESVNFIVVEQSQNQEKIAEKKLFCDNLINSNATIKSLRDGTIFQSEIQNLEGTFLLRVGPFEGDSLQAMVYLTLKEHFPNVFIFAQEHQAVRDSKEVKRVQENIYIPREVIVEKEDDTLWTAIFGLAIIGVLAMYLSSAQLKRIKEEHDKIQKKHHHLEQKQHQVLESMGENIHTMAKETMSRTSLLAEKVKETDFHEEMEKVMYNENELLGMTSDLIAFLRLKSKKVVIQNEIFNFNHVLNEISGVLNTIYKQNDTELIFDIDREVPRHLSSDSLHLGQIIINILEYIIQHSKDKEVILSVRGLSSLTEGLRLQFEISSDVMIDNKETFFDSYYDDESKRYVGLGLFVAKELTDLMDGEIVIEEREGCFVIVCTIPMDDEYKEKRKYRLPSKKLVGKKILIVDKNEHSSMAIGKLFAYYRAEITILSPEEFKLNRPNLYLYDICALNTGLFVKETVDVIRDIKLATNLKVISLVNLFSSKEPITNKVIDITLKTPLTQESVFDTLIELYKIDEKQDPLALTKNSNGQTLKIYRHGFQDSTNITLESFKTFKGSHILIVEDNIINQKVLLNILGKSEMKLSVANNGKEAIAFLTQSQEKVNFIFMDINMPVMDGYRATELIRKEKQFDDVVIVSLTALVSENEINKMFESGVNGYLSKPIKVEKLYSVLNMFLSKNIEKVENTVKVDTAPLVLDGLDIKEGLHHMKSNNIFYKEVLIEFIDAYSGSDVVFETLVHEHRYGQLKMLSLDMKGLTGTIGAREMHRLINEIYQHIIYNKPQLLDTYIERYRNELDKLTQSITIYLAS